VGRAGNAGARTNSARGGRVCATGTVRARGGPGCGLELAGGAYRARASVRSPRQPTTIIVSVETAGVCGRCREEVKVALQYLPVTGASGAAQTIKNPDRVCSCRSTRCCPRSLQRIHCQTLAGYSRRCSLYMMMMMMIYPCIYICMYICIYAYTCHRCSLRAEKGERKWGKGESGERDLELVHTKIHAKHKGRGGRSRACAYIYKRREI